MRYCKAKSKSENLRNIIIVVLRTAEWG